MPRDINMASNVTLGNPNGFPVTINIPVDQNPGNNYNVDYLLDGNILKRQQFDASANLTGETSVTRFVVTDNTTFESIASGLYNLTLRATLGEETVTVDYEMKSRLNID